MKTHKDMFMKLSVIVNIAKPVGIGVGALPPSNENVTGHFMVLKRRLCSTIKAMFF